MNAPRVRSAAAMLAVLGSTGCAAAGHTSSPWEWGGGVHITPGFVVGRDGGTTIHPAAAYTYLSFSGGHDDLFEFGAQVRRTLSPEAKGPGKLWLGGEANFSVLRSKISNFPSSSTTGWSVNALAGVPVSQSKWGVNLYAGAGTSHYGSQGFNIRAGVDLQPWFLKRTGSKGSKRR